MLHVADLSRCYGSFVALSDVTFSIPQDQIVAVLGPNGAGKSTLLRILAGALTASRGTASIGGFDVRRQRVAASAITGYLPENVPVYPDMTGLDTLRFFGAARGLRGARLQSRIQTVVGLCGLEAAALAPVGTLSRGLRQRVGIAQTLLHDPPFIMMDEPTAGLDPIQAAQFRAMLASLRGARTVMISTHLLELTASVDRVLIVHRGRVAFDGTPDALAAGGSIESAFHTLTSHDRSAAAHRERHLER